MGSLHTSVIDEIKALFIKVIAVKPCNLLASPVATHADMLLFHQGGNKIIAHASCTAEIATLHKLGFDVTVIDIPLSKSYPNDVFLNAAVIGSHIICNKQYTCSNILSDYKIIDVAQGYAKCSTLVVDKTSLITSDPSIHTATSAVGFSSLLIESGGVKLDGYSYGFIGGCGFKFSASEIYFTGNINSHKSAKQIKQFLSQRGISITCGKSPILIDVGSILPIMEE